MRGIGKAYFLQELSERELEKIEAITSAREHQDGDTIVAVGDEVKQLYVVATGRVRVVIPVEQSETTDDEILVTMSEGDCFGEFSFVDRKAAAVAVKADGQTTVYALDHKDLDDVMQADPQIAIKLQRAMLRTLVDRLRSTDADLAMARYVLKYV